jgi:aspartyl-tRNA(Asn)/glutamyl-tRNA(Gln) amidotransferase subunit A
MTEFAFSGIGLNFTHGTPLSVWNRSVGHVPGGSSSGAAVSVADAMAHAALGTDTGGSIRVPAAFNGLVGFKPTAMRASTEGTIPVSQTLDSVGYIGRSAACCAILDAIATDRSVARTDSISLSRLRFAVPSALLQRDVEAEVKYTFESALDSIAAGGAAVERVDLKSLALAEAVNADGGIASIESYAWHREHIRTKSRLYDAGVLRRIKLGASHDSAVYLEKLAKRRLFQEQIERELEGYDALLFPTAGLLPPRLRDVADNPVIHDAVHAEVLYNSRMVNLMDGCAISIPIHRAGAAPVGLTIACVRGRDEWLLRCACTMEHTLNRPLKEEMNA